jgi:hypothetical protein
MQTEANKGGDHHYAKPEKEGVERRAGENPDIP